jgi:hypothetical protein
VNDDIDKALSEIRARGEKLLDGFEDLLSNRADLDKLLPHLEELKNRQDDLLVIMDTIKKRTPAPSRRRRPK